MKRLLSLWLCLALLIALPNCGGDGEVVNPDAPAPDALPEQVLLSEQTHLLSSAQREELIAIDDANSTLRFAATLDETHIPTIGDILLQLTPTEKLPYGFLGRVTAVHKQGDAIEVHTEAPTLTEVFDAYQYRAEAFPAAKSDTRALAIDQDGYRMAVCDIDAPLPVGQGSTISCHLGYGFKITDDCLTIDELTQGPIVPSYTLSTKMAKQVEWHFGSDIAEEKRVDVGNGVLTSATVGGLPIAVYLQPTVVFSGSISRGITLSTEEEVVDTYLFAQHGMALPTFERVADACYHRVQYLPVLSFHLAGSAYLGLGLDIDFRLFGRKDFAIRVTTDAGGRIEGEVGVDAALTTYEAIKDNTIHCCALVHAGAGIDLTLLPAIDKAWHADLGELKVAEKEYYLVPDFTNTTYTETNNRVSARSHVSRDLLFPVEVGIAQYVDNMPRYGTPYPYQAEAAFQSPLTQEFETTSDAEYWTYIHLLGQYGKCAPVHEESEVSLVGKWRQLWWKDLSINYFHDLSDEYEGCILNADGTGGWWDDVSVDGYREDPIIYTVTERDGVTHVSIAFINKETGTPIYPPRECEVLELTKKTLMWIEDEDDLCYFERIK